MTDTGSTARSATFSVRGPIARSDLPGLSERVCGLFSANRGSLMYCDVRAVPADAVTVEALSRLQLVAKRYGCLVRLRNANPELLQLLAFLGLQDVLPT